MPTEASALVDLTHRVLGDFVAACQAAFGADLRSVVLYGSAAEDKQRSTSDVNLLLLLARFEQQQAQALREPMRTAHAAIQLRVMFLLEAELPAAAVVFADKFADMQRRHRVLFGADPLVQLGLSRRDQLWRLRQTLLNLVLRLRQRYVLASLRDEQAAQSIAEASGPLRSAAAEYFILFGTPQSSPKAALESIIAQLPAALGLGELLSAAREQKLGAGQGENALFQLIEVAEALRARVLALPEDA